MSTFKMGFQAFSLSGRQQMHSSRLVNMVALPLVLVISFACSPDTNTEQAEIPDLDTAIAAFESGLGAYRKYQTEGDNVSTEGGFAAWEKWSYGPEGKKLFDAYFSDLSKAYRQFEQLAKEGDPEAQRYFGLMRYHGFVSTVSRLSAVEWYEKAAAQGLASAQYELAHIIETCGTWDLQQKEGLCDSATAKSLFKLAADQGVEEAQYDLSFLTQSGNSVETTESAPGGLTSQATITSNTPTRPSSVNSTSDLSKFLVGSWCVLYKRKESYLSNSVFKVTVSDNDGNYLFYRKPASSEKWDADPKKGRFEFFQARYSDTGTKYFGAEGQNGLAFIVDAGGRAISWRNGLQNVGSVSQNSCAKYE